MNQVIEYGINRHHHRIGNININKGAILTLGEREGLAVTVFPPSSKGPSNVSSCAALSELVCALSAPCLALSGLVWPCLALSGLVWPCLALSGLVSACACFVARNLVCACLALSGLVWPCLALSGLVWALSEALFRLAHVSSRGLVCALSGLVWPCLALSGLVWPCLGADFFIRGSQ